MDGSSWSSLQSSRDWHSSSLSPLRSDGWHGWDGSSVPISWSPSWLPRSIGKLIPSSVSSHGSSLSVAQAPKPRSLQKRDADNLEFNSKTDSTCYAMSQFFIFSNENYHPFTTANDEYPEMSNIAVLTSSNRADNQKKSLHCKDFFVGALQDAEPLRLKSWQLLFFNI